MISSASNTPGQPLPGLTTPAGQKLAPSAAPTNTAAAQESLSANNTDSLRSALAALPEVRPGVVEKGKQLAADSNYPPRVIIEKLAELIAQSDDLTTQA